MAEGYEGWIGGRLEVYNFDEDPCYAVDEKRFFTSKRQEFLRWRWVWDGQYINEMMLARLEDKLEEFNRDSTCAGGMN